MLRPICGMKPVSSGMADATLTGVETFNET